MKKSKKVYLLIDWLNDTYADYTVFESRKEIYFNRPYFKTLAKAKKVYPWWWPGCENWPHCEVLTFANYDDYINGKDPISTKTYYK